MKTIDFLMRDLRKFGMYKILLYFFILIISQSVSAQPFAIDISTVPHAKGTILILEGCQRTARMESFWKSIEAASNRQGYNTIRWNTSERLGHTNNCTITWRERYKDSLALQKWVRHNFPGKLLAIGASQGAVAVTALASTNDWDLLIALSPQCDKPIQPNGTSRLVIFTGDLDTTSHTEICKTWNVEKFIEPSAYHGWQYSGGGVFTDKTGFNHIVGYNAKLSQKFWNWFWTIDGDNW